MSNTGGGRLAKSASTKPRVFKVLLIGDTSVGKSSLLLRFTEGEFASEMISTVGIDFKAKEVIANGEKVKLQVWDTAGQERFRTITSAYYRTCMGILLVYDVTNSQTFRSLNDWADQIAKYSSASVPRLIVANKVDLEDDRRVSTEEGVEFSNLSQVHYFETSARTGKGVDEVFQTLAEMVKKRQDEILEEGKTANERGVKLGGGKNKDESSKNGCCS